MIDSPTVAGDYFQKIAERIAVRIPQLKLLRMIPDTLIGYRFGSAKAGYQVAAVILSGYDRPVEESRDLLKVGVADA
jgi:hypothetical protein